MIRRFQIEDLIVQDSTGVVFRAIDSETGKTVAVRRFFPFGADGGGLQADEQIAYNIALERLAGLRHPALRAVVCGGCDPVDGMPYIATEWIEGTPLLPIIEHQGPVTPEVATELLTQALEVCELLSHVLAEEAVWVETELQTIVFGNEDTGRRFTFWISPLKWLGAGDDPRGLESIITLTEQIMGWKGRSVGDEEGRGLGMWLRWLRTAAPTTSLHEARETLAASIGAEPPASAKKLATRAAQPPAETQIAKPIRKSPPRTLLWVNIVLLLVCLGLGAWVWQRKHHKEPILVSLATDSAPSPAETMESTPLNATSDAERAQRIAAAINNTTAPAVQTPPTQKPSPTTQAAAPAPKAPAEPGVIQWNDQKALVGSNGKQVVIEGVLADVGLSEDKKSVVLFFSKPAGNDDARVVISMRKIPKDLTQTALAPLVGKKIRVSGKINVQNSPGVTRPNIQIGKRSDIKEL